MSYFTFSLGCVLLYLTVVKPWLAIREQRSYDELSLKLREVQIAALRRHYPSLRPLSPQEIDDTYDVPALYYRLGGN